MDYPEDRLAELIATAVGAADLRPRIERTSAFSFAAQIADRYRNQRGFIVGDAAHRMTPRGGTGMNTAIHDAYDLGWKLGWFLRGWAGPELVESYEAERRPVGLHNVLNGRVTHHWFRRGDSTISTLDLLGDGFTLLSSPRDPGWERAALNLDTRAPVVRHAMDEAAAHAIGVQPGGAVLLRPDGQRLLDRPNLTALHNRPIPSSLR